MSEPWVPVLAAVVGVLGGMGGAFIGGYVANEGQQQRFADERAAHIQDLRRGTYLKYVRELNNAIIIGGNPAKALNAQTEVSLLSSSPEVRSAARELGKIAGELNEAIRQKKRAKEDELSDAYDKKLDSFITLAQRELRSG